MSRGIVVGVALITLVLVPGCGDGVETPDGTTAVPETPLLHASPTPPLPTNAETPANINQSTQIASPTAWMSESKWHYTPAGSTCVYREAQQFEALYRDFKNAVVLSMDSENCPGSWYIYYPSTGEADGGFYEADNARLRLQLVEGSVIVLPGGDGCTWTEFRRVRDEEPTTGAPAERVMLSTPCAGEEDHRMWYYPESGELKLVVID